MSDLPASPRFVIVGAGIHGLSTAYHLAKELRTRGAGSGADVVVLEKSEPGAGASGIACGVVRNNYFQPAMSELMQACVEVWESDPAAYADLASCGRAFAFQTPGAILNSARSNVVDASFVSQLMRPDADRMPLILSNHDSFAGDRVWNQLNGNADQYRLAAAGYLLAARNPFTYYGEEIGMANAGTLSGDPALRTPMSWTSDPNNAGFSMVTPFRELSANSTTQNFELEADDGSSLLNFYRSILTLRNDYPVLAAGDLSVQSAGGDPVLLLTRSVAGEVGVVAINYDLVSRPVTASTGLANMPFDAIFGADGQVIADGAGDLTLIVPARSAVVFRRQP